MQVKSANKICAFYFHRTRELFSRGFLFIVRFFVCIIGSYVDRPIGTGLGFKMQGSQDRHSLRASACLIYLQMGFSSDENTKTFANEVDAPTRSPACRRYIFHDYDYHHLIFPRNVMTMHAKQPGIVTYRETQAILTFKYRCHLQHSTIVLIDRCSSPTSAQVIFSVGRLKFNQPTVTPHLAPQIFGLK
jgi:hypothetical protein